MSATHNTLDTCVKCLKCMKYCPIDAIHFADQKAVILDEKCIDCGRCMGICDHAGIYAQTSTLQNIKDYDYTCILAPAALYGQAKNDQEIYKIYAALQHMGFDEVIDLSAYGGGILKASVDYIAQYDSGFMISAHCPVITNLIYSRYPTLLSTVIPINYPSEVAAKVERERIHQEKGIAPDRIGIFLLCECAGKLGISKYPLKNMEYEVDHAISLSSILGTLHQTMNEITAAPEIRIAKEGLLYTLKDGVRRMMNDYSVINIDGIDKAIEVLELAEFDRLEGIRFINMSACYNGCVGGCFLYNNPFNGRIRLEELIKQASGPIKSITFEEAFHEVKPLNEKDMRTMKEKIEWFGKVEAVLAALPGIDCGACGFPSCKHMAEEITADRRSITDCRIK